MELFDTHEHLMPGWKVKKLTIACAVQAGNESREEVEAKEAEMRALGAEPDIYDKLMNSVAPSIWQMDDVKKGILCQLFGGSSKVHTHP